MTTYQQILTRLFFIFGLPFVLTEAIIKNPILPRATGAIRAAVRQYWDLLTFIALLRQSRKTGTNNKKYDCPD